MTPAEFNKMSTAFWSKIRYLDSGVAVAPPAPPTIIRPPHHHTPGQGWWMKCEAATTGREPSR